MADSAHLRLVAYIESVSRGVLHSMTFARAALSASLYATGDTPPSVFLPNSPSAVRCELTRVLDGKAG